MKRNQLIKLLLITLFISSFTLTGGGSLAKRVYHITSKDNITDSLEEIRQKNEAILQQYEYKLKNNYELVDKRKH